MKHTKGQWKAVNDSDGNYYIDCFDEGKNVLITQLSYDDGEANAKLIAAAPELLEALQQTLNTRLASSAEDKEVFDNIKQAIKKATD